MSNNRLAGIAERIVAARRQGTRVALAGPDAPADFEEGFAIQDFLTKPVQAEELLAALKRAGIPPHEASTILVVDDDARALKLMEVTLSHLGYSPNCQPDGESGLRVADEQPPAAVILDLLMPGMSGFEFLERFRRTAGGRATPVIVWTNADLTAVEHARLRATAQAVVQKSQGGRALLEQLQVCLAPSRREAGSGSPAGAP